MMTILTEFGVESRLEKEDYLQGLKISRMCGHDSVRFLLSLRNCRRHNISCRINGDTMKTFQVEFRYQDRKNGSEGSTVKVDASSLPGTVARAAREFVRGLDRKRGST